MSDKAPLLDGFPLLRPVAAEDIKPLQEAAKADGHGLFLPTHLVTKHGEIAGYMSIAAVPTVCCWFDTKKMHARDSMSVFNTAENMLRAQGAKFMFCPIQKSSPFHPVAEKLGFNYEFTSDMFVRKL